MRSAAAHASGREDASTAPSDADAEMRFTLRFGGDPEDVLVTTSGFASVEGLAAMGRAGVLDPRYRPGMRLLVDHRELDWRRMTAEDIQVRADRVLTEEGPRLAGSRVAVVVRRAADFGVLRMLSAHWEDRVAFDFAVFTSLEDARAWLASDPLRDDAGP